MNNNAIVSLADSNYFNLLNELVDSINNFSKWKYISSMHDFSKGKSRMKDMGVLFVLLISLVFPKFYSFKKLKS